MIPFRPLSLGELFDGTFAAIRSNPKVMFTISMGFMAIVGVIGGIIAAMTPQETVGGAITSDGYDVVFETIDVPSTFGFTGLHGILGLITAGVSLVVTGMLVLSVTNAVVGANLDLAATWAETKPRFWRLIGTALLVWLILMGLSFLALVLPLMLTGLFASGFSASRAVLGPLLLVPIGLAIVAWMSVRLYFATMVTVVEGVSPTQAISRSWALSQGAFWRILGRLILVGLIVSIVVGLVSGGLSALIMLGDNVWPWGLTAFLLALVSSLANGLAMPFSAAYGSLMYVDERIRKENLAPELARALAQNRARGI